MPSGRPDEPLPDQIGIPRYVEGKRHHPCPRTTSGSIPLASTTSATGGPPSHQSYGHGGDLRGEAPGGVEPDADQHGRLHHRRHHGENQQPANRPCVDSTAAPRACGSMGLLQNFAEDGARTNRLSHRPLELI
jgi:hypothetical protein